MTRHRLHGVAALGIAFGLLLPASLVAPAARAAVVRQSPPPAIAASSPTVTGKLVAKATGSSSPAPVSCTPGASAPAVMVKRGLVICTDDGRFVLLQLLSATRIYNRDWQRIGYAALALGDRLNAWGTLRDGGTRLYPTLAIEDLSRGGTHLQTVTGRLVATPDQPPTGRIVCGDHDQTSQAQAAVVRGVVICTEEGKLVLLQVSAGTRVRTHDGARVTLEDLTLGDTVSGTGKPQDGGLVMSPTNVIGDTDLVLRGTNSQDFIAGAGETLTLYVLSSDRGPVQGRVFASPGEPAHVRLCSGAEGTWAQLKSGLTVDVSHSIFNTRTMAYVDTSNVSVVSCG